MDKVKKTILAVKCAKCSAVYMAIDLTRGAIGCFGDELKEATEKDDEIFLTDCATMSECKCDILEKDESNE